MLFELQDCSKEQSCVVCRVQIRLNTCDCEKSDRTIKQSQTVAITTLRSAANVLTSTQ
jgi:Trp operon repressor